MDASTLASVAYTYASLDRGVGSKGRIILSEFRGEIDDQTVTAQQIIDAWQTKFPEYPIEQRTENTLIIEFGRIRK